MTDAKQIDEILSILKTNDFPLWGNPIALDRRDTSLYIQQLVDKYKEETDKCETYGASEEDLKEAEEEIKELKREIKKLEDDKNVLETEIGELREEITILNHDKRELETELRNQEDEITDLKGEI